MRGSALGGQQVDAPGDEARAVRAGAALDYDAIPVLQVAGLGHVERTRMTLGVAAAPEGGAGEGDVHVPIPLSRDRESRSTRSRRALHYAVDLVRVSPNFVRRLCSGRGLVSRQCGRHQRRGRQEHPKAATDESGTKPAAETQTHVSHAEIHSPRVTKMLMLD